MGTFRDLLNSAKRDEDLYQNLVIAFLGVIEKFK